MHGFFRTSLVTILFLSLCLIALPACPGEDAGKPAAGGAPAAGDAEAAVDLDAVVEKARKNIEKIRLTMAASRETQIEVTGAKRSKVPGLVMLELKVTREGRSAVRRIPVTPNLSHVVAGAIMPLGKIPRQRVQLENVTLEGSPERGQSDAQITLVEYSDFQCPYCRTAQPNIERLLREYDGKIKLIFKHYPLEIHEWAWDASLMSECARKQKPALFWKLHDYYYADSERLTRVNLLAKTKEVIKGDGIDMEAFTKCYLDQETAEVIRKDINEGRAIGVRGTPAFLLNDVFASGLLPYEVMAAIIQEELGEDWLDE